MSAAAMRQPAPLVTVLGASGFVGSAVVRTLAGREIRLRLVARGRAAVPAGCRADVEHRRADVCDPGSLDDVLLGSDAVVHLVAHSAGWRGADAHGDSERVNVGVMRDVIRVLNGARRSGPPPVVVFAGSISQVGVPPRIPLLGTEPDHPVSTYDRQKQAAERILCAAAAQGVVRGISLRLPTVYGDAPTGRARDRGVLATMVRRALADQELTMWHDGTVARDLTYVGDVATAFAAALDRPDELSGRHWLVGTGRAEPLGAAFRTIAAMVARWTGRAPVPVIQVPPPPGAAVADQHDMVADPSAFASATGWRPRIPLDDGLRRLIAATLDERG